MTTTLRRKRIRRRRASIPPSLQHDRPWRKTPARPGPGYRCSAGYAAGSAQRLATTGNGQTQSAYQAPSPPVIVTNWSARQGWPKSNWCMSLMSRCTALSVTVL
jgi:hypothetical protein